MAKTEIQQNRKNGQPLAVGPNGKPVFDSPFENYGNYQNRLADWSVRTSQQNRNRTAENG